MATVAIADHRDCRSQLRFRFLLVPLLGISLLSSQAVAPALTVVGEGGVEKSFTMAELKNLSQNEVGIVGEDSSRTVFRGPTLRSLMTLVGAPAGHALRGPSMLLAVVAEASDGYRVAFMLAELDEQFGARAAILALTQNGQLLPARDGPLRIVVPGEQHHARWARQVIRLRLVRVGGP